LFHCLANSAVSRYFTIMSNNTEQTNVIILHGFEKEEIYRLVKAIKSELGNNNEVAFAMTTATSLQTKLIDVIKDVQEEHDYFKRNPPKTS